MATVQELLQTKDGAMLSTSPDVTVLAAAILMNERGTGSVLIIEDDRLVGIFTERDLMRRVVAMVKDPASTPLRDVMTTALVTCTPQASMSDCGTLMSDRRIRHLPVIEGDKVVGMITTGDLLAHELKEKEAVIQQLESFVFYVRQ
ncbi:MAG TPA: CBS domain-containing protein [Gemmatimonadales bacterium]|nr:CBS domain-containing protein [Gemmatimonadales bacterium]